MAIIKYLLYSLCFTVYPCSLFYTWQFLRLNPLALFCPFPLPLPSGNHELVLYIGESPVRPITVPWESHRKCCELSFPVRSGLRQRWKAAWGHHGPMEPPVLPVTSQCLWVSALRHSHALNLSNVWVFLHVCSSSIPFRSSGPSWTCHL